MAKAIRVVWVVAAICVAGARPVAAQNAAETDRWPGVVIEDPMARAAIHSALDGAVEWFKKTRCQTVLTDFRDETGHPLAEKLAALGTGFEGYLQWVVIRDLSEAKWCDSPYTFAVTTPGNRVVFICARAFEKMARLEPSRAKAIIIHEVLHTLGLGENGRHPTSDDITRRVQARCLFRK